MPQVDLDAVAARLEALRVALGLNKGSFAQSFGLDESSYSKVLKAVKPVKSEYGFAIAQIWGVSMDYIYRGDLSRLDESLRAKIIANLNARDE